MELDLTRVLSKVQKAQDTTEISPVTINIAETFSTSIDNFIARFSYVNSLSDNEIFILTRDTYHMVLANTVGENNKSLTSMIFGNARYIQTLVNVLESEELSDEERIWCNKLTYDYFTLPDSHTKNKLIENLLIQLSNKINFTVFPELVGKGISLDLASNLAIARYSTSNELISVKRVNFLLFSTSDVNLITEQTIINVYQALFANSMTNLFKGIMFDIYNPQDLENASSDSREIYTLIGLAVLDMIMTMGYSDIRKILLAYKHDYDAMSSSIVRFSMRALSNDYVKINAVIVDLERERIFLP